MPLTRLIMGTTLAVTLASGAHAQVARLTTSEGTLMRDARTVYIEGGYLPGRGLVVVRPTKGGRTETSSLGKATIGAGEFRGVHVRLSRPVREGESLMLILHADQGRRGVYDGDPVVLTVPISEAVVARAAARG